MAKTLVNNSLMRLFAMNGLMICRQCSRQNVHQSLARALSTRALSGFNQHQRMPLIRSQSRNETTDTTVNSSTIPKMVPIAKPSTKAVITFTQAHEDLSSALLVTPKSIHPNDMMNLIFKIETSAHALHAISLLSRWREASKPWTPTDSYVLVEALLRTESYDVLLERICNAYQNGLIPRQRDIEALLKAFVRQCSSSEITEEDKVKALDNCYKTFAVVLYYHIVPTAEMYVDLMTAGIKCGTEEGRRRSSVTRNEAISLGYQVPDLAEL
ncbi:hypothetical protein SmJEL517_g04305 [Synchytrium microbalum]|uniref:Uncharacterized protein n=1 Tax=Synchytrium microbalum TaxID=1806994 RepID=A0A507BZQ0_9FUNG|nr:uncharacterized protein SmJEL517_g04305 [Synchytrium microbalum]TPX32588.1 hypothetical protein SmJEL517_g04305 [Synchytrium microbalum]